jgi:hypothetical protein
MMSAWERTFYLLSTLGICHGLRCDRHPGPGASSRGEQDDASPLLKPWARHMALLINDLHLLRCTECLASFLSFLGMPRVFGFVILGNRMKTAECFYSAAFILLPKGSNEFTKHEGVESSWGMRSIAMSIRVAPTTPGLRPSRYACLGRRGAARQRPGVRWQRARRMPARRHRFRSLLVWVR